MGRKISRKLLDGQMGRAQPAPHWKDLRQGDRVVVRLAPGFETSGLVEDMTPDYSTVWVHLDEGRGRTLLHCSDGVEILPHLS
ncbi:hypothetical protein V1638_13140 [Pseudarthrobacter sp. J64]|uniref:hypothetical protein n=1 Tax=Pseudarthrobacter sp. J64 TaxID=3116485 RepID=UPI002E7FC30E|nr:hypothetical protein [Pseudarthrobacter sp. J64]MEE2570336.1 hypothetical protein [Pseudarthrobacter sp. J64]